MNKKLIGTLFLTSLLIFLIFTFWQEPNTSNENQTPNLSSQSEPTKPTKQIVDPILKKEVNQTNIQTDAQKNLRYCDERIVYERETNNEIKLADTFPNLDTTAIDKFQFAKELEAEKRNLTQEIDAYKQCRSWLADLDNSLSQQANYSPLSPTTTASINEKKQQCQHHNTLLSYYLNKVLRPDRSKEIAQIRKNVDLLYEKKWDEIVERFQNPKLVDSFYVNVKGKPTTNTFLSRPEFENAPKSFFEDMMNAGYSISTKDIESAAFYWKDPTKFFELLSEQEIDFNRTFYGRTLFDIVAIRGASKSSHELMEFIKEQNIDPNIVYSNKDTLSLSLEYAEKYPNYDLSVLEFLLEQGAHVESRHFGMTTRPEVTTLLKEYECQW